MNIGFHLAVLAATFSFATAIAHFAISRAPGWRGARAFGTVALTATCYSLGNLVSCMDGLPFAAYSAGARWNYLFAALHVLSWYPVMFGGPDGTLRSMRLPLRGLVLADLGLTGVLLVTGWHMHAELRPTAVPWAGVVYHNLATTPLGDVYGAVQLACCCRRSPRCSGGTATESVATAGSWRASSSSWPARWSNCSSRIA
jgi:hypothetical protein